MSVEASGVQAARAEDGAARQYRVAYVMRPGRIERLAGPPGTWPSDLFYGYVELARREGWSVDLLERRETSWLGLRLQRLLHRFTHISPDFCDARNLGRGMLGRYDAIVSPNEPVLLMLAMRKRHPGDGARLVLILMGIEKRLARSRVPALTRRIVRWFFGRLGAIVVLGEGERDFVVSSGLAPAEKVHVVHFGTDVRFWTPGDPSTGGDELLAVGNDDGRDYETLLAAAGSRRLRIHTTLSVDPGRLGPGVTLSRGDYWGRTLSDAQLRDLYRRSLLVVTPLKDSSQPQGQSVALQAMACGKAVILTRTRGLWAPHLMQDGVNCLLVPPGDVGALRAAIERLVADEVLRRALGTSARRLVEEHLSIDRFAAGVGGAIEATLAS